MRFPAQLPPTFEEQDLIYNMLSAPQASGALIGHFTESDFLFMESLRNPSIDTEMMWNIIQQQSTYEEDTRYTVDSLSQLSIQQNIAIQSWESEQASYNDTIALVRDNIFNIDQTRLLVRSFVENQGRNICALQDMLVEIRLDFDSQSHDMNHLKTIHASLLRAYQSLQAAFDYDHSKFENYILESANALRSQRKRTAELEIAYASLAKGSKTAIEDHVTWLNELQTEHTALLVLHHDMSVIRDQFEADLDTAQAAVQANKLRIATLIARVNEEEAKASELDERNIKLENDALWFQSEFSRKEQTILGLNDIINDLRGQLNAASQVPLGTSASTLPRDFSAFKP